MSKADVFLKECQSSLGEWVCSVHTTESNQPAAIFREVKRLGYEFEEVAPNRWGTAVYCPICERTTTHYKLIKLHPVYTRQDRLSVDKKTRERILRLFDNRDAFTGASISSKAEIDHKVPWTRLEFDIDARLLTDAEIRTHFQLLTREHNLLKDRACSSCKISSIRPPFLSIPFWYEGDNEYRGTCIGCGWYDGERWRMEVTLTLQQLSQECLCRCDSVENRDQDEV